MWRELHRATCGNLLGAPLWRPDTRDVFLVTEPLPGEGVDEHQAAIGNIGRNFAFEVRYFDDIPHPVGII